MRVTSFGLGVTTLCGLLGCNQGCVSAFPKEFSDIARSTTAAILDNSDFTNITANVQGQVIDPGYEVMAGIQYVASVRLKGVSGQVGVAGSGAQSQPTSDATTDAINRQLLGDPALKKALADALVQALKAVGTSTKPVTGGSN